MHTTTLALSQQSMAPVWQCISYLLWMGMVACIFRLIWAGGLFAWHKYSDGEVGKIGSVIAPLAGAIIMGSSAAIAQVIIPS